MRKRRWLELIKDYDCEINYHPGKANVVVNSLSIKSSIELATLSISQPQFIMELKRLKLEAVIGDSLVLLLSMVIQPELLTKLIPIASESRSNLRRVKQKSFF
jgi:hypothetical protein